MHPLAQTLYSVIPAAAMLNEDDPFHFGPSPNFGRVGLAEFCGISEGQNAVLLALKVEEFGAVIHLIIFHDGKSGQDGLKKSRHSDRDLPRLCGGSKPQTAKGRGFLPCDRESCQTPTRKRGAPFL